MPITASNSKRADHSIAVLKTQGCDERVAHALQLFSSMLWAFKGVTAASWKTTTPEDADVVVLHGQDREDARKHWKSLGKLIVEIASGEGTSTSPLTLTYPFRAEHVRTLLDRLETQLGETSALSNNDRSSDAHTVKDHTKTHAPFATGPEWKFIEALRAIRARDDKRRWIAARNGETTVLHLQWNAAAYFADPRIVAAIRSGTLNFNTLRLEESGPPAGGATLRSGHELLWFAAYYASDRLASSLSGAGSIKLKRWPNIAIIRPESFQLRITAALAAGESRIEQLAKRATVGPTQVIRTLNALAAANLVTASDTAHQPAATPPWRAENPPRKGFAAFLRDVRRHLGLSTNP